MSSTTGFTLELLRGGPPHNQLLSPTTEYFALCGDAAPHLLRIPIEHRDLSDRLATLGYDSRVTDELRQAEIARFGRDLGATLGGIPNFGHEIQNLCGHDGAALVHIRLVLAGNELAAIPWELAHVPTSLPAAGAPLLIQSRTPVSLTREARGAARRRFDWDREPRILFAAAQAADFPPNLIEAHLLALRQAVEPWAWRGWWRHRSRGAQWPIRLLLEASVDEIRAACDAEDFTHVHILAHGVELGDPRAGRFGLLLHDAKHAGREVVSGDRLARAIGTFDGTRRSDPLLVSLATCDGAALPSPIVPGGSIAHDLHQSGVPWVVASQFPLTATGSVVLARELYGGILSGEDPRVVLSRLRARLLARHGDRHDWAALVAYASISDALEADLVRFRMRDADARRDHAYTLIDHIAVARIHGVRSDPRKIKDASTALDDALRAFKRAHGDPSTGGDLKRPQVQHRAEAADLHASLGALEKRRAELLWMATPGSEAWRTSLCAARQHYLDGASESLDAHWNLGQATVLGAVLARFPPPGFAREDFEDRGSLHERAASAATFAVEHGDLDAKMWGWTTLAELHLVNRSTGGAVAAIREVLRFRIPARESAIWTTFRQFWRFVEWWSQPDWADEAAQVYGLLEPLAVPRFADTT